MSAVNPKAIEQAVDAVDEINAAVGIIAMLHAEQLLTDADVRAAVDCITADLAIIRRALGIGDIRLPILTLGEVVARAKVRANPLKLIEGGLSS